MFVVVFIVLSITIHSNSDNRTRFFYIFLSAVCVVSVAVVVCAPGNFSRINDPQFLNKSFWWTITGAASITVLYLLKWGTSILVVTLACLFFLRKLIIRQLADRSVIVINFRKSLLSFLLMFAAVQVFVIYAAGGGNLGRIENNLYLFFLLGFTFNLYVFINKYFNRRSFNLFLNKPFAVITGLLFLLNVCDVENDISSAYVDILSGRAKRYDQELTERLVLIKSCKTDTCYVPALTVTPKTLFVTDIRLASETNYLWINESYAKFYRSPFPLPSGNPPPVEPNLEIIRRVGKEIRKNIVKHN
jgi:hypothetical protein